MWNLDDKNNIELNNIKEYNISKDNKIYKASLKYNNQNITIKCDNFSINLNFEDVIKLTKINFKNFNEAYNYLNTLFEENKIRIKYIKKKKRMRLDYEKDENESIVITLNYDNSITSQKVKKYTYFKFGIFNENINSYYGVTENEDMTNMEDKDELINLYMNLLEIFYSINNILYCIYLNNNNNIICYHMDHKQIICKINNQERIINLKHCTDIKNKRDLFISLSELNLKVYNMNNMECFIKIKGIKLSNVCFLNKNENIKILYSCYESVTLLYYRLEIPNYKIKIIDLNGNTLDIINQKNTPINILLL